MDIIKVIIPGFIFLILLSNSIGINKLDLVGLKIKRGFFAKLHFFFSIYTALLFTSLAFVLLFTFDSPTQDSIMELNNLEFDFYYLLIILYFLYDWPFIIINIFSESDWGDLLSCALLFVPHFWIQSLHQTITVKVKTVEEETRESAYRLVIDPFTFKRSHSYDFFYFYTVPPFFVYLVLSFVTLAIMSIDFFIYINSTGG